MLSGILQAKSTKIFSSVNTFIFFCLLDKKKAFANCFFAKAFN